MSSLEELVTEVIAYLADPLLTAANVVRGRRHLHAHATAPRVVFVPTGGPHEYPDRVGGDLIDPAVRAKCLAVRQFGVQVYCHGRTEEEAETLLEQLFRAVRNTLHGAVRFGGEQWLNEEPGEEAFVRDGCHVVFDFTWQIPIFDVDRNLTAVVGFDEIEDFNGEEIPCDE